MGLKYVNLDNKKEADEYKRKKEEQMKKRSYNNMYNNSEETKETLQNESTKEDTPIVEENKSVDPEVKEESKIYESNSPVSPDTKAEVKGVDNLRIRKHPSAEADVICTVPRGYILKVLSKSNSKTPWYEIKTVVDGKEIHGHVMGEYVDVYVEG